MTTLPIGSISHGTLRDQDLAQAIYDALRSTGDRKDSDLIMRELFHVANGDDESEFASEIVNDGIDALSDYCPPFCYAGMHEGDGSDLGIWPDLEALEAAVADGDVIKIGDLADLDSLAVSELRGANMAMLVNDHGNVTLFELHIAAKAVWDCV